MKDSERLVVEAKEIIARELQSFTPKFNHNSRAGRQLRELFVLNCLDGIDAPFTNCLAEVIANQKDNAVTDEKVIIPLTPDYKSFKPGVARW